MKRLLTALVALAFIVVSATADTPLVKIWGASDYQIGALNTDGTVTSEPMYVDKFTQFGRPLGEFEGDILMVWKDQQGQVTIPKKNNYFVGISLKDGDDRHPVLEIADLGVVVTYDWQLGGFLWGPKEPTFIDTTINAVWAGHFHPPTKLDGKILWVESVQISETKTRIVYLSETDNRKKTFHLIDVEQLRGEHHSRDVVIIGEGVTLRYEPTIEIKGEVASQFSISPDGKKIAYSQYVDTFDRFKVHILDTRTRQAKVVFPDKTTPQSELYPLWSPDGTKISITMYGGEVSEHACVYDFKTKALTHATNPPYTITTNLGWRRGPAHLLRKEKSDPLLKTEE